MRVEDSDSYINTIRLYGWDGECFKLQQLAYEKGVKLTIEDYFLSKSEEKDFSKKFVAEMLLLKSQEEKTIKDTSYMFPFKEEH
jgi:hypothetical protein